MGEYSDDGDVDLEVRKVFWAQFENMGFLRFGVFKGGECESERDLTFGGEGEEL